MQLLSGQFRAWSLTVIGCLAALLLSSSATSQGLVQGQHFVRLENRTAQQLNYYTSWSSITGARATGWRRWQIEPNSVAICSGPVGFTTMVIKFHSGGQYGKVIETVIEGTHEGPRDISTRIFDRNDRGYLRLYTIVEHKQELSGQ